MTTHSKRLVAIGGVTVVMLGAGVFLARGTLFHEPDAAEQLIAQVRDTPEDQRFDQMREIRDKARDLPDEQREKFREGMHGMFEDMINTRVDEYENATTEEEKVAILDKHLDEFQQFRKRMEEERERRRKEREASGESGEGGNGGRPGDGAGPPEGGPPGDGNGPGARSGRGPGGSRGAPSVAERKQRMEGGNPDAQARRMRYFTKLMARAKERGMDMPGPGGRGGRGGPGGPGRGRE
ncbi:MAG: hypothetical protein H6817_09940 [Phycisphaerales bacterium]|nr:hypothetical protein [Phycisphaerales bacterium]